jgi:AraC-like DNA-binding protein
LSSGVIHCSKELQSAFFLLLQESRKEDPLSGYAVKNMLERILILANREARETVPVQQPLGVSGALAYIHKHFKERITMEDVCKKCGYSVSSLCRNFKEQTGMTMVAYINKQRLDHAERMLLTLEDTVGDICFACGFTSVRQFNRAFKNVYGCTPTEYRNIHCGKIRL